MSRRCSWASTATPRTRGAQRRCCRRPVPGRHQRTQTWPLRVGAVVVADVEGAAGVVGVAGAAGAAERLFRAVQEYRFLSSVLYHKDLVVNMLGQMELHRTQTRHVYFCRRPRMGGLPRAHLDDVVAHPPCTALAVAAAAGAGKTTMLLAQQPRHWLPPAPPALAWPAMGLLLRGSSGTVTRADNRRCRTCSEGGRGGSGRDGSRDGGRCRGGVSGGAARSPSAPPVGQSRLGCRGSALPAAAAPDKGPSRARPTALGVAVPAGRCRQPGGGGVAGVSDNS